MYFDFCDKPECLWDCRTPRKRWKARLAQSIAGAITRKRLTQDEAASVLGIDQPKVSALLRGRLTGFSTDRLFRFLILLDHDVQIVIKSKPRSREHGKIDVVAA